MLLEDLGSYVRSCTSEHLTCPPFSDSFVLLCMKIWKRSSPHWIFFLSFEAQHLSCSALSQNAVNHVLQKCWQNNKKEHCTLCLRLFFFSFPVGRSWKIFCVFVHTTLCACHSYLHFKNIAYLIWKVLKKEKFQNTVVDFFFFYF